MLSDDQAQELLALTRSADSVELKLTVSEERRNSTLTALGIDPLEAYIRQIFFFDTADLALDKAGVVTRARRSQGRPDDSVVKLRPVEPTTLKAHDRKSEDFFVEVDAMPGGYVCSASYKGMLKKPRVKDAIAGKLPLSKLFSKPQRAFFAANTPEGVELDDLVVLGPVTAFKLKTRPRAKGPQLAVELWSYPDGSRILELSTKCLPADAFKVAARAREYLSGVGVELGDAQQTKTRTALEYFARDLGLPGGVMLRLAVSHDGPRELVVKALTLAVGQNRQVAREQRNCGEEHPDDAHHSAPGRYLGSLRRPHVDSEDSHARSLACQPPKSDQVGVEDCDPGHGAKHRLEAADIDRDLAEGFGDQGNDRSHGEEARLHNRDVCGEGAPASDNAGKLDGV